jgi:pectate lyase
MPNRSALLLGTLLLVLVTPLVATSSRSAAVQPPTPFVDVSGSMFAADIAWLYQSGVTRGCSASRFCPEGTVTRGQFASFLARLQGLPATSKDFFKDDDGSPHEPDINRVAAARATGGCGDGNFCPNQPITRDQIAALLVRAEGIDVKPRANYFWDDDESDHHFAINRLATVGLTQGCGSGRYCPERSVTRAQIAAFFHRMATGERRAPTPMPIAPSPAPTPPAPVAPTPTPAPIGGIPQPSSSPAPVAPPATVGVAGYGAASKGGAGGKVLSVTNLNDSGPGSLRAAIDASGPRVVVFGVAGTINLAGDLRVDDPFLTLDGSTAPGPVVVRGGMLLVTTHDVIVRHLRFRPGDQVGSPADVDAVTLNGLRGEVYNVVLDHVSMVWGPDIGGLSLLGNVHDVTVQYSIMGEGLYLSRHPEAVASQDGHSMGASIFQLDPGVAWPKRLTLHHNLFTTSDNRMPVIQGAECVDVVNNVIYNWGIKSLSGNPRGLNAVNNWFRPGPETTSLYVYQWQKHSANPDPYANSVYLSGNVADGFGYAVEAPGGVVRSGPACGGLSVGVRSAQAGFDTVVATAGATLPARDAVDGRIIANVINRSGTFFNGAGHSSPNPYYP